MYLGHTKTLRTKEGSTSSFLGEGLPRQQESGQDGHPRRRGTKCAARKLQIEACPLIGITSLAQTSFLDISIRYNNMRECLSVHIGQVDRSSELDTCVNIPIILRQESRWATPVGISTAWNTDFCLMALCPPTPLTTMTAFPLFSQRQVSSCLGRFKVINLIS